MKIRNGFVSNSSSSSFCIMGAVCSDLNIDTNVNDEDLTMYEFLEAKHVGYQHGISEYYEDYVAGLSASEMKDTETLLEFKQRALKEVQKVDPTATINMIEWRIDGGHD